MNVFKRFRTLPKRVHATIIAALCAIIFLACGSTANAGQSIGNAAQGSSSTTTSQTQQHFKVGDQVKVGDTVIVTINSFKAITSQNEFEQPKTGNKYVAVDVSVNVLCNYYWQILAI